MGQSCYLFRDEHIPPRAAFPCVDAHNHTWGRWQAEKIVRVMEQVGVVSYCDLTANVRLTFEQGGYVLGPGDIREFFDNCGCAYPGKFYCFTMAGFARPTDQPLYTDAPQFVAECIDVLRRHAEMGARGLKVLKELGLHYRNRTGDLISCDSPELSDIWEEAGRLNLPVIIHQSDPYGFFQPVTPDNEHYASLEKYPSWNFSDPKFPSKAHLLERRDNLVRRHPNTTFILPHVANFAESLDYVSRLLDENPNVYIDFSARLDELGRQPYTARDFFIKHQDRILFGTDMPADTEASVDMYRCYFRFLETFDEGFYAPDYDGTFDRHRWPICGIALPGPVLEKIYYRNALNIIPGLSEDLAGVLPDR